MTDTPWKNSDNTNNFGPISIYFLSLRLSIYLRKGVIWLYFWGYSERVKNIMIVLSELKKSYTYTMNMAVVVNINIILTYLFFKQTLNRTSSFMLKMCLTTIINLPSSLSAVCLNVISLITNTLWP